MAVRSSSTARRELKEAEALQPAVGEENEFDIVEEASQESFPASDAPAWTLGTESYTDIVSPAKRGRRARSQAK